MKNEEDNERLWLKIILVLIFMTGLFIGLAIQSNKIEPTQKLQDNILEAFNSSLIIKEISYGTMFFDLDSKEPEKDYIDIMADNIVQCESSGDHSKVGDQNYYVNGVWTPSRGIAQFQERTFNFLKGLIGNDSLDYTKKEDQMYVLKWALRNGYGEYWTCYKLLGYNK